MQRKRQNKVLFTNDHYNQPKRGNRHKNVQDQPARMPLKSFDFQYSFNDYVKLSLCRIIPSFHQKLTFIPARDTVIGEQKHFYQLKAQASQQLQAFKYIHVKNKTEAELDELDYQLEEGMRLFRPGVVKLALGQLEKWDHFKLPIKNMQAKLGPRITLMRVQRKHQARANQIINQLFNKQKEQDNSRQTQQNGNIQTQVDTSIQSNEHDLSMTYFEHDDEDENNCKDSKIILINSNEQKPSVSESQRNLLKEESNKSYSQMVEDEDEEYDSIVLNSLEESEATINITQQDHSTSKHIYNQPSQVSPEEQSTFILRNLNLEDPI